MLKGILFIALIIITFDIGMYFVDKNKEQLKLDDTVDAENYLDETQAGKELQGQVESEEVIQTLIDVSLPEDVIVDERPDAEFGQEDKLKVLMDNTDTEGK